MPARSTVRSAIILVLGEKPYLQTSERVSFRVLFGVLFFEFRHSDRAVKARANRRAIDPVTRGLEGTRDFLSGKHRMHSARGLFAFGNGVHYFASAIGTVAAGKNVRQIGLAGLAVMGDDATLIELDRGKELLQYLDLFLFADGSDHHVERLGESGVAQYLQAAIRAGGAGQFQTSHVAGAIRENFQRREVKKKFAPVSFGHFLFELVGGHFFPAAAINQYGPLGA